MAPDRARPLSGEVALVTGAGKGIGRATALELAARGASVIAVARTKADVDDVARAVEAAGGRALALAADVSEPAAVAALRPACEAAGLGAVSILVNNAGIAESAPFLKTSLELFRRHMRVNVESALLVTQSFLGGMVERRRGRVVMIASIAGKQGAPYIAAYSASKHAMIGLMRSIAAEHAASGVTVNAVCPGYVDTPMTDRSLESMQAKTKKSEAELRGFLAKGSPQGRLFTAEEVAAVVAALASEGFAGVNGQAIHLDGGAVQG